MKNFIIVGTQRTGSSALAELIGFHPDIACGWEWTLRVPVILKLKATERALNGDFSLLPDKEQEHMNSIIKLRKSWLGYRQLFRSSNKWLIHPKMAPALWVDRLDGYIKWIRKNPNIHIIHLVRDDNIAWLKSKYFSKKTNSYVGNAYPDDVNITIPTHEAVARLLSKKWVDTRLSILKDTNPYHQVWYEDFLIDKYVVAKSIYKFLDCDVATVNFSHFDGRKRQSSGMLTKGINNYDELLSKLTELQLLRERSF